MGCGMTFQIITFVVAIAMGALTAWIADRKHRSPAWGIAGMLFWPVALPWVLLLRAQEPPTSQEHVAVDDRVIVQIAIGAMVICCVGIALDAWVLAISG